MKKVVKILLVLLILGSFINVKADDKTLGDLKKELANLKAEKASNDASKSKTQLEINSQNNQIANAYAAIEQAEKDIETAKLQIEKSNQDIEKAKEESAKLLVFYELMQGDNFIMEYVSGATTMTDLMMRIDAVSQILKYNEEKLNEFEQLITENEELQIELKKKEETLNGNIKTYESSLASLKKDLSSLVEISLDIDQQINAQKEVIEMYESLGCKDDQLLSVCLGFNNNTRWVRPLTKGYISSGFGYRSFTLNGRPYSDFHNGTDIAGNAGGTSVYASASGVVAAIIRKASCGGNQVYLHVYVNGQPYTVTFAHLMSINVNVGDIVNINTVIGTVGGGGSTLRVNGGWDTCSTGYHLHYGVAKGHYLGGGYSSYSKYVANSIAPTGFPALGSWFYSRY